MPEANRFWCIDCQLRQWPRGRLHRWDKKGNRIKKKEEIVEEEELQDKVDRKSKEIIPENMQIENENIAFWRAAETRSPIDFVFQGEKEKVAFEGSKSDNFK